MLLVAAVLLGGCGGGSSEETVTGPEGQAMPLSRFAQMFTRNPAELHAICGGIEKKGSMATLAEFEKSWKTTPISHDVPAADLFSEIAKHCP